MRRNEYSLSIAGVAFHVQSDLAFARTESDSTYSAFEVTRRRTGRARFEIPVRIRSVPNIRLPRMPLLFDADDTWAIYSDGDNRCLVYPSVSPFITVRFGYKVSEVAIECAPRCIRHGELISPMRYPLDQLLLMYALAARGGVIVHGCAVNCGGKSALLVGRSGAGKTTLARLCSAAGIEVLSDDRVVVRAARGTLKTYGTPWPGEGGMALNRGVPLAGLLFLRQARRNRVARTDRGDVMKELLPVLSVPWYDTPATCRALDTVGAMLNQVPVRTLEFTRDARAVETICRAL